MGHFQCRKKEGDFVDYFQALRPLLTHRDAYLVIESPLAVNSTAALCSLKSKTSLPWLWLSARSRVPCGWWIHNSPKATAVTCYASRRLTWQAAFFFRSSFFSVMVLGSVMTGRNDQGSVARAPRSLPSSFMSGICALYMEILSTRNAAF